jgi:ABC-type branched-subunit amino acid transport system ATPase component
MGAVEAPETPQATAPCLVASGLVKRFGGITALDGADLEVTRGSMSALIGPNGAGKSTLFNVATGVVRPDAGTVRINDTDVTGRSLAEVARTGTARTFQTPRGFGSMTAMENLLVVPDVRGERLSGALLPWRAQRRRLRAKGEEVLERIGLGGLGDRRYDELSAGQTRLLEIGRHLMREIDLLLLDEPTAGVIPSMQERLGRLLTELRDGGMTILIVEHNLGFVLPLASRVSVMVKGRLLRSGTPQEIQRDQDVIDAYLGGGGR